VQLRRVGVEAVDDVVDEAVGRRHRPGPVVGRTAGPAGNAQLTAGAPAAAPLPTAAAAWHAEQHEPPPGVPSEH
jgi:hypothetical protein